MSTAILLGILLLVLGAIAFVLLEYLSRENRVGRVELLDQDESPISISSPMFRRMFELFTNTSLDEGHRVEILYNGDPTYDRLIEDIRSARSLITWHVFQFVSGELADRVIEALAERARVGVRVLLLLDAFGSWHLKKRDRQRLTEAGIEVHVFRPFHWRVLYKLQARMHIRAVVIDGSIGWTGGFGIDDRWKGAGRQPGEWRDTNARLHGPAVNQLQAAFAANWAETTGSLLLGDELFSLPESGTEGTVCGVMHSAPSLGSTNAERYFVLSIDCARNRLYITNPYFIPDHDLRNLLGDAVARGVDVRILTPGANNDRMSVFHASRRHYEELLEAGIRIWEYEPSMIHAKTIAADGLLFSIGTINFDNRSIMLNDEVTLLGLDRSVAGELENVFLEDLGHAVEIQLDVFRRRPFTSRIKERAAGLLQPIL